MPKIRPKSAKRGLTCLHLGTLVEHAKCACPGKNTYRCDRLEKDVRPRADCETCAAYEKDE